MILRNVFKSLIFLDLSGHVSHSGSLLNITTAVKFTYLGCFSKIECEM